MKTCSKCLTKKHINQFHLDKTKISGIYSSCKQCRIKPKLIKPKKDIELKKLEARIRAKKWASLNKQRINEYHRTKRKTDINYKLRYYIRTRINKVIKRHSRLGSAIKDSGCSVDFLKTYIESKFTVGMNWTNWGNNGWHLDHIIPLCSFNLENREEFLKAVHYTNLQPLWAKDNLRKGAKLIDKGINNENIRI